MTTKPRSGAGVTLRSGGYEAQIATVGTSLRALRHDGRDLVVPFPADEIRPAYRGALLAPWPNRVVDGRYRRDGQEYQLDLSEPDRGHALHGLVGWLDFSVRDSGDTAVTLEAVIVPRTSYPWRVRVQTTFRLAEDGLTQTVVAANEAQTAAPFGTGPHPYLVAGPNPLDTWELELPASRVLEVTPDRLVPVGLRDVAADAARFDWRVPRPLGAVTIDHAFTGMDVDQAGSTGVRLTDPDGTGVLMRWDAACPWVQVHTADLPGGPAQPGHRAGLAVEPMTCAPDAFNAERYDFDAGLLLIPPGGSISVSWRIASL